MAAAMATGFYVMDIRNFFNKGKAGETINKASAKTPPAKAKAPETQRNTPPVKKPATPSPAKKKTPARGKRAAVEDSESDDEVVEVKPTASRRSKYFPKEVAKKVAKGRGRRKVVSESEDDDDDFVPAKHQVEEKDDEMKDLEDEEKEEKPAARKPQARRKPAAQSNKRKAEAPAAAKEAKKPAAAKPELQAEAPISAQKPAGGGGARWAGGKPPWMQERVPPPHKGEKDRLSLERDEAEDLIKRHGGRITSAVSSKTTYVVTDMDPGGSKSKKAHELGTPIITEDELFDMIRKASAAKPATKAATTKAPVKPPEKPKAMSKDTGKAAAPAPVSKKGAAPPLPDDNSQLWTTKYAPKSTEDIIGNNAQVARLRDWLANWDSNRLGGTAEKKGAGSSKGRWGKGGDGSDKKAVLLYGSPGVGKTTAAHIVSKALGFIVFEVNASDTRNKAEKDIRNGMHGSTANIMKEMITNTALPFVKGDAVSGVGQGKASDGHMKKMVDGMSGGDRGGVADLIQSIHKSMVPIICICNDKYSQKIKSLLNHVLELEFRRPTKQQASCMQALAGITCCAFMLLTILDGLFFRHHVAKRLGWIASQEGLSTNDAAIEKLVESVQSDIRLSLNVMQMWRTKSNKLQYDDVQAHMRSASKDMDISPFVAADRVFKSDSSLSLGDRMNLVFYDADLVPLLIQENYINHRPFNARNECERMECISRAADSIADGDMVSRRIRRFQRWNLMPAYAVMACVTPAMCVRGSREALHPSDHYNRFSAWLGKNSSEGKNKRLLQELCTHLLISGNFHTGRSGCRLDYMPVLREALTKPLREDGLSAVTTVVDTMNEYCITRDDWQNILDITQFKGKPNPTEGVATNVKSAFTRTYNTQLAEHAVKSSVLLPELKVPGRKPKLTKRVTNLLESADGGDVAPARDDEVDIGSEGEEGEEDAQEEEEDIKPEYIPGVKVKGAGGRGKGAAAAASRGKSTKSRRGGGSGRGRGKSS
eukprot:jgi/Chlat1/3980/Chrsp26S04217